MTDDKAERLLEGISVLLRLFLVSEAQFPSAGGKTRYNAIDFQTLRYVERHPGCRGSQIARYLGVAPTTQQSALDRLIRKGLIVREDHPEIAGAKVHRLTPEGAALRQAIHDQDIDNMQAMLALMNCEEQETVLAVIDRIAERLARPNG